MTTTTIPTEPPLYDVTVAPRRRERPGLAPSLLNPAWTAGQTDGRYGWFAELRSTEHGLILEVSRLDGESHWTIDAATAANGRPLFRNGYAARYLLTRRLTGENAAQLDALIATDAR